MTQVEAWSVENHICGQDTAVGCENFPAFRFYGVDLRQLFFGEFVPVGSRENSVIDKLIHDAAG